MKFLNNPFDIVIQATKELYGDIDTDIQFDDRIKFFKFGLFRYGNHCGETIFPYNNSTPLINISTNIPFNRMPEILAHELAHVVAGQNENIVKSGKIYFIKFMKDLL
jgi:hypothetical protein